MFHCILIIFHFHTLTVATVTLSSREYSAQERDGRVRIELQKSGDMSRSTSVLLRTQSLSSDPRHAQGGDHF